MAKGAPQRKGTGRGHAYEQLRESILGLPLWPGARIDEGALVRDLRMLRTPVREALTLAQRATHRWAALRRTREDIVRIEAEHHRFTRIARSDPAEVPDVNRAFHAAVAQASRNAFLTEAYGELLDQGLRLSRFTVIYDPPEGLTRRRHFDAVIADHEALLKAIRSQDANAAERRAAAHAKLFRKRVVDYLTAGDDAADVAIAE